MLVKGISGRFPGKNFAGWNGKALWECNVDKLKAIGLDVVIITDETSDCVIDGVCRPGWIGNKTQDVLDWWVESTPIVEPIFLVQATNPFVDFEFLEICKDKFKELSISRLVSINPATCKPDGSAYITRDGKLYGEGLWVAYRGRLNMMACDIDTYEDYCIARAISEGRVLNVE